MRLAKVCGRDVVLPDPKDDRQVVNYVANFLLNQNCTCSDDGFCHYRNNDKTRACAAGCLIPDEDYNESFESGTVLEGIPCMYFTEKGYSIDLLRKLQRLHDGEEVKNWPTKFEEFVDTNS